MKRTKEQRSVTLALVVYARLNLCGDLDTPFDTYRRIEGACGKNRELALDLWSVRELITFLKLRNDEQTLMALNEIYFIPFSKYTQRRIRRSEISSRILRFAHDNYLNERTVYRKLKNARDLWKKIRYEIN